MQKDKERRERREAKAAAAAAVADEDDEVLQLRSLPAHSRRPLRRFFFPSSSSAAAAADGGATKKSDASQLQVGGWQDGDGGGGNSILCAVPGFPMFSLGCCHFVVNYVQPADIELPTENGKKLSCSQAQLGQATGLNVA